jgi:hypothetical protein
MRTILGVSLLAILFCVSFGAAELVTPRKSEAEQAVPAYSIRPFMDTFKKGELARVIGNGRGSSCLGVYVFDSQGNCVAWDDKSEARTGDDFYAEWIPAEQERFNIEIRNAGPEANLFRIALR